MVKPTLAILCAFLLVGCTVMSDEAVRRHETAVDTEHVAMGHPVPADSPQDGVSLDPETRRIIGLYGDDIKSYAESYGLDWRLVLAVMKQESRFASNAESKAGAKGLMQIMPVTGEEVSRKLDLVDVYKPANNIHGGIYYLRRLYDRFRGNDETDRLKLALAAYNAGYSRILDAQALATYLHGDPATWRSVSSALPLLSKPHSTLHARVWNQDRPRSGWFRRPGETVVYVDRVMGYYDEFRLLLN
jgi:membrane-bound lytic murein transglycosylase F